MEMEMEINRCTDPWTRTGAKKKTFFFFFFWYMGVGLQTPTGSRETTNAIVSSAWTEMFPRPQRHVRTPHPVATLFEHPRAPPLQTPEPPPRGIQKAEKDHDDAEREAGIQRRGERHGVLGPPEGGAAAEVRVEEEADEGPDGEVEARGRGDPAQAAEEDGEVDFAEDAGLAAAATDEPDEDRGDEADGEGPDEGSVEGAGAEEALRADDAPEDAAVEVHAGDGAGEAVDGFGGADFGDVGEHPVQDADLDDARDEGGGDLDLEEEFGGDLHVVAEFEVGGELDALRGGDVAVCDKDLVNLNRISEDCPVLWLVENCSPC